MWPFFNQTNEVVTFCLHGWCMLGVFLLLAFTCLGHERQDLLSPCDEMHACTDYTSVYTLIRKSFGGMESESMLTPRIFFFSFPSYISGVHHFWVRFLRMWPFFNPTIKVVTFRLRGWCVLGVFLLLAFTRLGHEHQDLLSPCDEMHVCTD